MTTATDPALERAIGALAVPRVLIGHRLIAPDDAQALRPDERDAFANSVDKVKRASGAARIVARGLMARLGQPEQSIPKSASGAPIWPAGYIGSLAHDAHVAVAALARRDEFESLGIDIEPAEPLDADLLDIVTTPSERQEIAGNMLQGRLLFTIKEAVYKATHPLDGAFLEHHDVEVALAAGVAATRTGRTVRFRHAVSSHIVVLALI